MLREGESNQRPLMPYASHVSRGTARTPIGIILFAASHLLMGAVLMLAAFMILRRVMARPRKEDWGVVVNIIVALPMLTGGLALFLKGRAARTAAVMSFSVLAALESIVIAYAVGMTVRYIADGNQNAEWALLFVTFAVLLAFLSRDVLGYLASEKARATFALPPGETPIAIRIMPRLALFLYCVAVMIGPFLSGRRGLFPD
jgi:hypothetical protein